MTYASRGRSIIEVIIATVVVCFLTGFVAVLCIGNYYRAKKAMERHRQRRLARLSQGVGYPGDLDQVADGSPGSNYSNATSGGSNERQHLLARPPELPRRRNNNINDDLLLFSNDNDNQRQPTILRV
jgi:hypothetical protein